nr:hypothetical protein [Pareuzebyella sediminis]
MTKDSKIHGVDMSQDVFDVEGPNGDHHQFHNSAKGFGQSL